MNDFFRLAALKQHYPEPSHNSSSNHDLPALEDRATSQVSASESLPPAVRVRAVRVDDLKAVALLLTESFYPPEQWQRWVLPILQSGIYQDLHGRLRSRASHQVCLVAVPSQPQTDSAPSVELAGTVEVGLGSLIPWQPLASRYPYISNLAVKPTCRRQGVAQSLLRVCERTARDWGFKSIYLHVAENNRAARKLYFKAGYRVEHADPIWFTSFWGRPRRLFLRKRLA